MAGKKRFSHIDLLESIAIFFVVTYHSTLYTFDILQDNSILNNFLYFGRTILSTCVPLFFFANGYLLFNKEFILSKHIKKTIRLILLVFIWGLLLMPIYMIIAREPLRIKTIVLSLLNLDIPWGMNLFWFLGALICMYILFPALKALFDKSEKSFLSFTIACAVLTFGFVFGNQVLSFLSTVSHHNLGSLNYPALTMFNPFRGSYGYSFVYFCVGGLIYKYEDRILSVKRAKRNTIAIIGLLVSCGCLFLVGVFYSKYFDGKLWDVVWNGYDTVFTFFNVIFIYLLCLNYQKNNIFIRNISYNTLGIYFTHGTIIRLTRPWIKTQDLFCNLPVNLLYAFLIVCVCLLICILLRKIPVLNKLI